MGRRVCGTSPLKDREILPGSFRCPEREQDMSKELVISSNRHETKVAMLEDDQLVEIFFQRAHEYSLAGSIHKGRVTRVLPGMQSAFVNIGLERDAFLYVSDFFEEGEDYEAVSVMDAVRKPGSRDDRPRDERPREERPRDGSREDRGRRSRRGRDDRPAEGRLSEPRPIEPQVAEVGSVRAEDDDADLTEASELAPATTVPLAESGDDRRGGRRRRRRRPGGRSGLPESKYADPGAIEEADEFEGEASVEGSGDLEPIILPGESLAKYSGRAAGPDFDEDEPETDEIVLRDDAPAMTLPAMASSAVSVPAASVPTVPTVTVASVEELEDTPELIGDEHPDDDLEAHIEALQANAEAALAEPAEEEDEDEDEPLETSDDEPEDEDDDSEDEVDDPEEVEAGESDSEEDDEERPLSAFQELIREAEARAAERAGDDEFALDAAMISEAEAETEAEDEVRARAFDLIDEAPVAIAGESREGGDRGRSRRSRRRRGGRDRAPAAELAPSQDAPADLDLLPGETRAARPDRSEDRGEERGADRREGRREERRERPQRESRPMPNISDLLKEGQEIIVQIAKEPLGQKGARITSHIALPGRYVVYMPTLDHLGVSRKIGTDEERARLKRVLQAAKEGLPGGFITRTAAEGRTDDEITADVKYLHNLWMEMKAKAERRPAPLLLHHDLDLVQRVLRDHLSEEFKTIWVDNEQVYESVLSFLTRFQQQLVARVKMYTRATPIFDAFGVTQELEKALRPKVWLKSGGYIVINQTEALVAIDINTGKYVGKQNNRLEDTIVKTNTEAVKEIVRQIRLRDLGGIIVVDFIDMDERKNRQKVMQALEEAMRSDRAPYKILQFNDFGLVAITRKRVKQSLERTLCMPCPHCEGAGYIKSVTTVIGEILVEAQKYAKVVEGDDVILRVNPDVAKVLKSHENQYLEELEGILARPVLVKGDHQIHHEKFDLS
jgi:ribonuclease G